MDEIYRYFVAGDVERGRAYDWKQPFSRLSDDGLETQPWVTRTEARLEAKKDGAKAAFFNSIAEALISESLATTRDALEPIAANQRKGGTHE